ncbi:MAG: V-type ATP synthase subunit E [Oscillospiraceae bacterium]|nr:V-type ATP synthase subunit E [Oscillospiraceae bacterium]
MRGAQEKIERFTAAIESDALNESKMILDGVKLEIDAAVSAAEDEALNETFRHIKEQAARIRTQCGGRVSRHMMERKNAINARREEMGAQVMDDVRAKLAEYVKTGEYVARLKRSARDVLDALGNGNMIIYLREADMPLADELKKALGVNEAYGFSVTFKPGDIELGGLAAVCPKTRLRADETLDTKLYELRGHFAELFGLHLSQ